MLPTVELDESGIFLETHTDEFVTVNLAMFVAEERKRLAGNKKIRYWFYFKKRLALILRLEITPSKILANVNALGFYFNCETEEGKESKKIMEGFYEITPYPVPVKVFDDKADAINWLKQFV